MRLLDRYILLQFLKIFAVCVIGIPLMFIVIDVTDHLDRYLAEGATTAEVVLHYIYEFPYHSLLGFPIAALLSSVFTVSTMTRHFEMTAAKAGGISFYRLTISLILTSIVLSVLALGLTEIVPVYNRRAVEVLGQRQSRSQTLRVSFAFRGNDGRVYWIRRLDSEAGSISDIQIHREGTGHEYPTYAINADSAAWDSTANMWVVHNGRLRFLPDTQSIRTVRFAELWQRPFTETPEALLAKPKKEEEMQYAELTRFIEAKERSGTRANNLIVERALRLSFPFTCFIIVLFGTPLAHSNRRGGAPASLGLALATTIVYMIMIRICHALGAGGVVDPTLAVWLPNMFFGFAGLVLMARVRT